ncbi:peptidoglycan D,D-transpeptidase FtsI family protein [Bifidobacterium olomucense]|uniref:Penicillin-binding protein n=1 Tax=Bifidobacterium olomucense TaxID=2675324 RepID=A0A7Y0HW78_9BIFI|nr:penicillin-binding transpeptidase domain-containing protein [Bifidobacterium sp. DSM 109959]NMM98910.1 penicillin-binding protein [Bifidobacterium sp. DSM 109959]
MNKYLRQLFTAVVALFVVLGISSTIIMAVRVNVLNNDSRNARSLYHQLGAYRGAILASDGTVMAKSEPVNDAFKYQRTYSNGPLYAPITGFFSINQPADRGIEASRSTLLNGEADSLIWQRAKAMLTGSVNQGASIETSIDPKLQQVAYDQLGNRDGAAVAIEVSSGRILAMASTPSYDPNMLATHDTEAATKAYTELAAGANSPLINRATSQLYPPGSTFKTIVAAAALETGKYQTDTQIPAGETYTLPGTATQLPNATTQANGTNGQITLQNAIAWSSNTAFAQLGVKLGSDTVSDMATSLGFGSTITIDGSDATGTPMKATASTFPTDLTDDRLALASIGQGDTTATPLQMAMVAQAIANNGKVMQPTLVDRVRAADLTVLSQTKAQSMGIAFSKDTADKLTEMMEHVVTDANPQLAIDGVTVAAKTGTAQIGADNSSIDGWVIGFAPADNPQIAVAVVVHNTDLYGSFAAGPIMRAMIEEALQQ